MDIFTMNDLKILAEKENGPCVSIFMPTDRTDAEQNRIRFKNLLGKAEKMIASVGKGEVNMGQGLEGAAGLLDDPAFWQNQSDGFVLFLSPEMLETYRLLTEFPELVVVTDRFHIKPLVPFITSNARFYILAVSQGNVRLFQCTRQAFQQVETEGMPQGLERALKYDDPEKQLQFHTGAGGVGGKRPAVFHGHGVGTDDAKDRIVRYFREIDKWLRAVMREEIHPLVFVGVDYLFPIFKETTSYPQLLGEGIPGNPEEMEEREFHSKAWGLVEPYIRKAQEDAAERYRDLMGTGKTSKYIEEILWAAVHGRVAVLFVAQGMQKWGRFDREGGRVEVHRNQKPGDEDLLDLAAVQTLLKGGQAYVVKQEKVPDAGPAAALFRY